MGLLLEPILHINSGVLHVIVVGADVEYIIEKLSMDECTQQVSLDVQFLIV